jgi:tricarballylate dehydrogenase
MQDVHHQNFLNTISEYNDSIRKDVRFDPNIKDGRTTSVSR